MHFLVNTQGLGYSQEGAAPLVPLNEWHQWVGTYDGSQVKLCKDGLLCGASITPAAIWQRS